VVDLDASYTIPGTGGRTSLSVNANNIFNIYYYSRTGTVSALQTVQLGGGNTFNPGSVFYNLGAPSTVYGTLKVKF
jgi:outer membrane receptor protein involved in Fe transport